MRRHRFLAGTCLAVAVLGAACRSVEPSYVPEAEWAPDIHGGHERLERAIALADSLDSTSMMVIHGGRVAARLGDVAEGGYIASVRKSVMAMLYGPSVADGVIRLDASLGELGISDVGGLLPRERRATVRDLLAARSGVYHPAANGGDDSEHAPPRGSVEPGSHFLYNNWDFNTLGGILERATGMGVFQLLEERLAVPLGMQDHDPSGDWLAQDSARSIFPAYHMVLSTRDMARLGLLMLREGRWGPDQVLAADWVRMVSSLVTPRSELNPPALREDPLGYGYLWWVFDDPALPDAFRGAYTAEGAFGQFITVIPRLDVVVAHKVRVPPYDRQVTRAQYMAILNAVVAAFD